MKKLVFILLFSTCLSVFAQGDRIDSLLNDLIFNDSTYIELIQSSKYDIIYAGTSFNNKTYYAGREVGSDLINGTGHLYYFSHTGLYAGASGLWYDQLSPSYNSTTLSLGYGHAIGKKNLFRAKATYSRFIYNDTSSTTSYPYDNNINLALSFRKNWYGARISGNYLFGDESTINFMPSIYTSFYFWKFGKNNKFYFGPEISSYFGTETINTSSGTQDVFGLLNTQVYIPLGINLGNFELQFGYTLNLPYTQDGETSYPVSSSYSVSASYMIPIEIK